MTSPMLTEAATEAAAAASEWDLEAGPAAFLAAQDRPALARVVCDAMEQNAPDLGRQMPLARVAVDAILGERPA